MNLFVLNLLSILLVLTPQCRQIDIILVVDMSGSVYRHEEFVVEAVDAFVNRFNLSNDGIRIGVIVFASEVDTKVVSAITGNKDILNSRLDYLRTLNANGTTALANALFITANEFIDSGRPNVHRVVVVLSDGEPDNVNYSHLRALELMQIHNVLMCGILIRTNGINENFMRLIAPDCYVSVEYEELVTILKQLSICI